MGIKDDRFPRLADDLIATLDALGMYVVKCEPLVTIMDNRPLDVSLTEGLIRKKCTLTVDVECIIGESAWALSDMGDKLPPKDEAFLMLDFHNYDDIISLWQLVNSEMEPDEAEYS